MKTLEQDSNAAINDLTEKTSFQSENNLVKQEKNNKQVKDPTKSSTYFPSSNLLINSVSGSTNVEKYIELTDDVHVTVKDVDRLETIYHCTEKHFVKDLSNSDKSSKSD